MHHLFVSFLVWFQRKKNIYLFVELSYLVSFWYTTEYARQLTGKGPNFQENQGRRVEFPECRVVVIAGSLLTHCQIQHGVGRGDRGGAPPHTHPREAQTYQVSFPKHLSRLRWLLAGYLGGVSSRTNLRIHFLQHTIVILEEGNRPYPVALNATCLCPKRPLTDGT